jgi:hypothetical protein
MYFSLYKGRFNYASSSVYDPKRESYPDQLRPLVSYLLSDSLKNEPIISENLTSKALTLRHHRLHPHGHLLDAYNDDRFACMRF